MIKQFRHTVLIALFALMLAPVANANPRAETAAQVFLDICMKAPQQGQLNSLEFTRKGFKRDHASTSGGSLLKKGATLHTYKHPNGYLGGSVFFDAVTRDVCSVSYSQSKNTSADALVVAKYLAQKLGSSQIRKNKQNMARGLYQVPAGAYLADIRATPRKSFVHINIKRNKR